MWKKTTYGLLAIGLIALTAQAAPHSRHAKSSFGGALNGTFVSEIFESNGHLDIFLATRYGDRYDRKGRHWDRHRGHRGHRRDGWNRGHRRDGWHRYDQDYRHYEYGSRWRDRYGYHGKGHYVIRKKKVWVPGHWDYQRNRYGHRVKCWVPGHWDWRRIKVWVPRRGYSGGYCR